MAEQWLIGLPDRLKRTPELATKLTGSSFDEIVVVNASAGWTWKRFATAWIPLAGEVLSLVRTAHVMHDVTTTRRRVALVHPSGNMPQTALVHIGQSPYTVPDSFGSKGAGARRWLGDTAEHRAEWRATVNRNAAVPTVLRKLGQTTSVDLVHHSYTLAAANLHVLLGYPLPHRSPAEIKKEIENWLA